MTTTIVYLVACGGDLAPAKEQRALRRIGRAIPSFDFAAHAGGEAPRRALLHLLRGITYPPRPRASWLGAKYKMPTRKDLDELLSRLPPGVFPSVEALLALDHHATGLIAARAVWAIEHWARDHYGVPSLLVLDPVLLHLAMWSTSSNFMSPEPLVRPHRFTLELSFIPDIDTITRRTVAFPPGEVVRIPYPAG